MSFKESLFTKNIEESQQDRDGLAKKLKETRSEEEVIFGKDGRDRAATILKDAKETDEYEKAKTIEAVRKDIFKSLTKEDQQEYLKKLELNKFIKEYPEFEKSCLEGEIRIPDVIAGETITDKFLEDVDLWRERYREASRSFDKKYAAYPKILSVDNGARNIMDSPDFKSTGEEKKFKCVYITAKDLGFPEGGKFEDIVSEAKKRGFEQPPHDIVCGVLESLEQDEKISIPANPIKNDEGKSLNLLAMRGRKTRSCSTELANSDTFFNYNSKFVFIRK